MHLCIHFFGGVFLLLGQAGGCLKQCRKGRSMKSKDMNFKIIPFVYNFFVTLPETNSPLEKEIPIENHYFLGGLC